MFNKKTMLELCKFTGLTALMYGCALYGRMCYMGGFGTDMMIMVLSYVFAFIGFISTFKMYSLLFLYINLLISVKAGSYYCTTLYYERIGHDDMSLYIGEILGNISMAVAIISISIFLLIRLASIILQKRQ